MNSLKIKKNDKVVVLSGKDKGKTGKVLGTIPSERKVVVEGINMVTCHIKPRRQGEEGGIIHYGKPEWAIAYAKRIGALMDQLIAGGVTRVVWFRLPAMREAVTQAHADLVNEIVEREAAAESRAASYPPSFIHPQGETRIAEPLL